MSGEKVCPTCGPTTAEQHPRRPAVTRCGNCKEWLLTLPTPMPSEVAETTAGEREIKVAIRTLLPGLRVGNYAERWSPQSPAVLALNVLCQYVGEPVEPAGDEIDTHIPTTHHRRPAGNPPPAVAASTGTSEDDERMAWCLCSDFGPIMPGDTHERRCSDLWLRLAAREAAARAEAWEAAADLADTQIVLWSGVPGLHPTEPEPHPAAIAAAGARRTLTVLRSRMSEAFDDLVAREGR